MRKLFLGASMFGVLLGAGCAHQSAGYAAVGYPIDECGFSEDSYGYDRYPYTCVFYQATPAVPARLQVVLGPRRPPPRTVQRDGDPIGRPEPGTGGSSSPASSASIPQPAPVAREPVVLASPAVDRSVRPHN